MPVWLTAARRPVPPAEGNGPAYASSAAAAAAASSFAAAAATTAALSAAATAPVAAADTAPLGLAGRQLRVLCAVASARQAGARLQLPVTFRPTTDGRRFCSLVRSALHPKSLTISPQEIPQNYLSEFSYNSKAS